MCKYGTVNTIYAAWILFNLANFQKFAKFIKKSVNILYPYTNALPVSQK